MGRWRKGGGAMPHPMHITAVPGDILVPATAKPLAIPVVEKTEHHPDHGYNVGPEDGPKEVPPHQPVPGEDDLADHAAHFG